MKCKNSEFDDNPEVTAYMQVQDITLKNNDKVFVFNGWTFSSSPSITLFDHPVYDIWLIKCYQIIFSLSNQDTLKSESINFGLNAGLKMEDVIDVISKGAAQSWQMENRYKTMIDDKFDFGFAVDWMRKDLKICLDESRKNKARLPITSIIDQFYSQIQENNGGRMDTSSLITLLKKTQFC